MQRMLKRLIDSLGEELTLAVVTQGAYNTSTGGISTTEVTYTVKGYLSEYMLDQVPQGSAVLGSRRLYLSAFDTSYVALPEPKAGDIIRKTDEDDARIKNTQIITSGEDVVCYICHLEE